MEFMSLFERLALGQISAAEFEKYMIDSSEEVRKAFIANDSKKMRAMLDAKMKFADSQQITVINNKKFADNQQVVAVSY